jgi:thiol-disulfide isomerase/thioredoxin
MKRSGLLLFLLFPLVGIIGMVVIIGGSSGDDAPVAVNASPTPRYPTPAPVNLTLEPTVTVVPVLGSLAPDTPMTTLDGDPMQLADFMGEIVILNFWATWCPPCVEEMPTLRDFQNANSDVTVVAVTNPNDGQTLDAVEQFVADYDLDNLVIGLEPENKLASWMRAFNLPTTFVIDTDNVVRFRQIGIVTEDDLNYYVSELR